MSVTSILLGLMHHVAVGEDEAVRRKKKTRTMPARRPGDIRILGSPPLGASLNFDVEDRRADPFRGADHGARIGVKQCVIRSRVRH